MNIYVINMYICTNMYINKYANMYIVNRIKPVTNKTVKLSKLQLPSDTHDRNAFPRNAYVRSIERTADPNEGLEGSH